MKADSARGKRTSVSLDPALVEQARDVLGEKTIIAAVERALREAIVKRGERDRLVSSLIVIGAPTIARPRRFQSTLPDGAEQGME